MSRTIHADTLAALDDDYFERCILVKLALDSTTEYWTDYGHDLDYDSDTYDSASSFIKLGPVTDNSTIQVGSFSLTAQNVDKTILALFMNQNLVGNRLDLWTAVVSGGAIVGDPILLKGNAQVTSYSASSGDNTALVTINCASHWANYQVQAGRRSTLASQQRFFPNDTAFKNASVTTNTKAWGASS